MKTWRTTLQSRKYLIRIYLVILFMIFLMTAILSTTVYYNVQKRMYDSVSANSSKIVNQMKYNLEYLDEMMRNLTISTYNNYDVRSLMYLNDNESFDDMNVINKLNASVIPSNAFLHSIYIYNNNNNKYYSTFGKFDHSDTGLDKLLEERKTLPILKPILRELEIREGDEPSSFIPVISYVMYELTDEEMKMDGAVILNFKLDWLLRNIQTLNGGDDSSNDKLWIMDDRKQFVKVGSPIGEEGLRLQDKLKETYAESVEDGASARTDIETQTLTIDGQKTLVSYIPIQNTGWVLFKTVPYQTAYDVIHSLRASILVIAVIILAFSLLLSAQISRGLYRPVRNLLHQVQSRNGQSTGRAGDEFSFLQAAYAESDEQLVKYRQEQNSNSQIMKHYALRKWLMNSDLTTEDELALVEGFDANEPFAVCVLKIDNQKSFVEAHTPKERDTLHFAVTNTTLEWIGELFKAEAVEMKSDHLVIIVNLTPGPVQENMERLAEQIGKSQHYLRSTYKLSLSASIGKAAPDWRGLTGAYEQALDQMAYRFVHGKQALITPLIAYRKQGGVELDEVLDLANPFVERLKRGDAAGAEAKLGELLKQVRKLEYSEMMLALMHLVNRLKDAMYEINQKRSRPVNFNAALTSGEWFELETLEEFQERIVKFLRDIPEDETNAGNPQNAMTTETIKRIIETNYMDSELGVPMIAEMLKLSSYKVGKVFKENAQMTIPEYINHTRMVKAVEWMGNSKLSIGEIMLKVGIENESHFYKVFKAKYGTTPRDYMAKRMLEE
ncbi:helix-turn-helix domain-containing protein [Paenibacillus sp. LHD-117]|uniref:helix-turn-helix domain-containing protein n=1 Tax=Paenibacillus sp. LHD-117 TaxID=3071412 RepID=UPI0027E09B5D|nr:helix-turn-helix domain-containing protein [Paenibacillus sp. LHD-117]MDQ6419360.1 helix-turn-helix domain-containing protein [Paenibacillus sp. LHD-117]